MSEPGQPSVRPLGWLAVGLAVVALVLAPTYFFSLHACLAAAVAGGLGAVARTDGPSRRLGSVAVTAAGVAVVVATAMLVVV